MSPRATLYILLPLSTLLALILVSQGVVQNFSAYKDVTTIETVAFQEPKVDTAGNPVKDASGTPVIENKTTRTQTLPMDRWHRRKRSRRSAPMRRVPERQFLASL